MNKMNNKPEKSITFKQGLIRARSHLIFLVGLASAFGLVLSLENLDETTSKREKVMATTISNNHSQEQQITKTAQIAPQSIRKLTKQELDWARIAWKYFQNNTIPSTGLVNSVNQYKAATLWDTSSYLMAIISAYRLGLIAEDEFNQRVTGVLGALARMPLFDNKLPNKSYNTETLQMVDYNNKPSQKGIGWSAIDIGRLLVPINILVWNYPQHTQSAGLVLKRWDTKPLFKEGVLYGATVNDKGETIYLQEGRLGYEEYAAKSFNLMGSDVSSALSYVDFLHFEKIDDIQVATDSRDPEVYQAHNYVVSEPYILDGIEFGWDRISAEFAWRVYAAQQQRFKRTGILTAVSEDNIDQAPYFVYNTVFTGGKAWSAITDQGEDASAFKTLSTKAVFGWHMLYQSEYTKQLMDQIQDAYDPNLGWYSGIYEKDDSPNKAITANTNGIILESLAFRQNGTLLKVGAY